MRLKRLQLQGYKTFANKTEFIFDEGITAIVGPNGSGKSNVADAVRWVLGEQSFSELRSKRTTDMIFAGSQSRPRAGMAVATLTLDNESGWLPIDYAEVELSRRAYRSGENEYYLNGSKVRLRDIRDLLATSGLAQRTYTMIGQGLIDRALSLKSDERRALFEEAAGISHYKARRAETLRRLKETQRNLERVNDVLEEIKPRLRSLKRQANRAQNYGQTQTELQALLQVWYGYQWAQVQERMGRCEVAAVSAEKSWKTSRRKRLFLQEQLDDARQTLNMYQTKLQQKEAARSAIREQLEGARRQVAILSERQTLVSRQLKEIGQELPDLEAQRRQAQAELDEATTELAQVQTQLQQERQVLVQFESTFQTQRNEVQHWQRRVQELERTFQNSQRKLSQAEGQIEQLQSQLAEHERQQFERAELEQNSSKLNELDTDIKALKAELATLREQRREVGNQRHGLVRELKQLRREQGEKNRALNGINKEIARLEARSDLLNQMRQKATKVKGNAHIIGRFAQLLTIPTDHQTALEAALNARLGARIVPDKSNLWQLFESNLKETLLAVATDNLTVPTCPTVPDHPGVIGWATSQVNYKPEDANVVGLLLNPVLLVNDPEAAYLVAQQLPLGTMAVSPNGTIFHAGGLVERRNLNTRDSILTQEKEWRAAAGRVEAERLKLQGMQAEVKRRDEVLRGVQDSADSHAATNQKLGRQEQLKSQQLSQLQRERDRTQQHTNFLQRQRADHENALQRLQTRIAELDQGMTERQTALQACKTDWGEARVKLEALPIAEAKQQRAQQQQTIAATKTIVDGRRAVADSRRATLGQVENRLSRQQQRWDSLQQQQQAINLDQEQVKLDALIKRDELLAQEIVPIQSLRQKIQGEMATADGNLAVFQKQAHEQETHYTETQLAFSQQQNKRDSLRERIRADLGSVVLEADSEEKQPPLPLADAVEKLPTVKQLPEGIEGRIQKMRSRLQQMGAINPDAPQEYQATQERVDFMAQQVEDLQQTEGQLRKVIGDLDTLTSQEFAKTVTKVNGIFGEMFTQLFGGGSAELILTNPDDITLSGVDIVAQLPRRRAQGLGLLSGGERSLTAAALIFALLKVTPPPFCVMDETDAALDEANINRFRDALQALSEKTQFIVITHNRGTVQAANTIYGISMGRDSASQVISIKAEDYVNSEFDG